METSPSFNLDQAVAASTKSTSGREWAPRVFWLLFGYFSAGTISGVLGSAIYALISVFWPQFAHQPDWFAEAQNIVLVRVAPLVVAGYCLARGVPRFVASRLATRAQVTAVVGVLLLIQYATSVYITVKVEGPAADQFNFGYYFLNLLFQGSWLIVPIIWLAPRQANAQPVTAPKKAGPFNLDAAIAAWRAELARQPGLVPADVRELEAHLRDSYMELRKSQPSDEAAFLLARHRLGSAEPVAAEFAKAAPQRVWTRRIFWLVTGVFAAEAWQSIIRYVLLMMDNELGRLGLPGAPTIIIAILNDLLLLYVPLFVAGYWLVRGVPQWVLARLTTRAQVAALGGVFFFLANFPLLFYWLKEIFWFVSGPADYSYIYSDVVWQICLGVLMVWLTPANPKAKARVAAA